MDFSKENLDRIVAKNDIFKLEQNRFDNYDNIEKIAKFLLIAFEKTKNINYNHSSYGIKHMIEEEFDYMRNSEFILAAIMAGFKYNPEKDTCNPSFNMKESDINYFHQRRNRIHETRGYNFNTEIWFGGKILN
jgi:hypothetical protein